MSPRLGAIADDYTGATDLATTLVARGYRTRVYFGVPDRISPEEIRDVDAAVIGLKSRSAPPAQAVAEARRALSRLRESGCTRFYDKYCATFDSTPEGNIGPILDALLEDLGLDRTVVVLPFPEAGRTVYNGHLFVDGDPLDETSMRDHPLTPMTDSRIKRLLEPQTRRPVHELNHRILTAGSRDVRKNLDRLGPGIVVLDAIDRTDLDVIAEALAEAPLVSGGAGLAASFAPPRAELRDRSFATATGPSAILAGSASWETQAQTARGRAELPSLKLDFAALRSDFDAETTRIADWAAEHWQSRPDTPVLVYSVGGPEDIDLAPDPSGVSTSELTESALARLSQLLVDRGLRRLIVAGGETSGSVTQALGISSFEVDRPLSPGIAWASARVAGGEPFNLLLKSGSLGDLDIFLNAWSRLDTPA